jgi:hypothetical protein
MYTWKLCSVSGDVFVEKKFVILCSKAAACMTGANGRDVVRKTLISRRRLLERIQFMDCDNEAEGCTLHTI